jgi:hypothetical protein
MTDIFKHLIDLIKDKTTSWGFKTALFISVISILFLGDYYLGFSYNYYLNNKIEQLEKINNLKINYEADSLTVVSLSKMEQRVFEKKHYSDRIAQLFIKDSIDSIDSKNTDIIINNENQTTDNHLYIKEKPIRSLFWMTLSSNYLFAIILPFLIFLPLYSKDGRKTSAIAGWFASIIMIGIVAAVSTWISYQIPLIWDKPIWNYSLNFLIHSIFWFIIFKLNNNK